MKTSKVLIHTIAGILLVALISTPAFNVQAQTDNSIFKLVYHSNPNALSELLDNGANVNKLTKVGITPLMAAAQTGDREIVKILLAHNADVNIQNKAGATALMIAAKHGHKHVINTLLKHDADPTIKTKRGYTAAIFAMGYKHYSIHEQLQSAENNYTAKS